MDINYISVLRKKLANTMRKMKVDESGQSWRQYEQLLMLLDIAELDGFQPKPKMSGHTPEEVLLDYARANKLFVPTSSDLDILTAEL